MKHRKIVLINLLAFIFLMPCLYAEDSLPTEKIIGNSYTFKDKENNLKQIYSFKKDSTYSFITKYSFIEMIVNGKYEINGNEVTLYPEKPEAKVFGIKVKDEDMEVKASAYEPVLFDCFVYKDGILLNGDFYKK